MCCDCLGLLAVVLVAEFGFGVLGSALLGWWFSGVAWLFGVICVVVWLDLLLLTLVIVLVGGLLPCG